MADRNEVICNISEILDAWEDSFSDYPKQYKPKFDKEKKHSELIKLSQDQDIWLCRDRESNRIIGFAAVSCKKPMASLTAVKVMPGWLKNEVNAALGFLIVEHYINREGFGYVNDGERNVRHITSYQDFLIRTLGFHKAYCRLHIVYHPLVKPIVAILYPIRNIIGKVGRHSSLVYNIYCLLKQEQYARACRRTSF